LLQFKLIYDYIRTSVHQNLKSRSAFLISTKILPITFLNKKKIRKNMKIV